MRRSLRRCWPIVAGLLLLGVAAASPCGTVLAVNRPPVFRLDPCLERWLPLCLSSDMASVTTSGSASGSCNKAEWLVGIKNRVTVFGCAPELTKSAEPVTPNIKTLERGVRFQVPCGQFASWMVTIRVVNGISSAMTDAVVSDRFGGEFAVEVATVSKGHVAKAVSGATAKVHLTWEIGSLAPEEEAVLTLLVTTDRNPAGKQEFTSTGQYCMNSGASLTYRLFGQRQSATSGSIWIVATSPLDCRLDDLDPRVETYPAVEVPTLAVAGVPQASQLSTGTISEQVGTLSTPVQADLTRQPDRQPLGVDGQEQFVTLVTPPPPDPGDDSVMTISLSTCDYVWQIRKPGAYVGEPVEVRVWSNRQVALTFSGFADLPLAPPTGAASIPVYYCFSDTTPPPDLSSWVRADSLNSLSKKTQLSELGSTVVWKLWPRLEVRDSTRAGDYENSAKLTFSVVEVCPAVATDGTGDAARESQPAVLEGVKWD